ncbi:MAG TPA: hypothetical protein PK867_09840, partial [Pirellulales bacterium]|nr:hypothetical protein [Pirellulales bacterium]
MRRQLPNGPLDELDGDRIEQLVELIRQVSNDRESRPGACPACGGFFITPFFPGKLRRFDIGDTQRRQQIGGRSRLSDFTQQRWFARDARNGGEDLNLQLRRRLRS